MYENILITLEATPTDRPIIDHVKKLAAAMHSRVMLFHVATGVPAQFRGPDAGGQEIEQDREYLRQIQSEFADASVRAETHLAFGDPFTEIVKYVRGNPCDLVAMSTHGHQLMMDLILGSTASRVQHHVSVPVLLLRAR